MFAHRFSLDQTKAVPVDTHVWQFAQRYIPSLSKQKNVSKKSYNVIHAHFHDLHGGYSGWAHNILFAAELSMFGERTGKVSPVKKRKSHQNNTLSPKKVRILRLLPNY